jgi:hypothetical protein
VGPRVEPRVNRHNNKKRLILVVLLDRTGWPNVVSVFVTEDVTAPSIMTHRMTLSITTFRIMTVRIMTVSITTLSVTVKK